MNATATPANFSAAQQVEHGNVGIFCHGVQPRDHVNRYRIRLSAAKTALKAAVERKAKEDELTRLRSAVCNASYVLSEVEKALL
jgi:hypothetical protein